MVEGDRALVLDTDSFFHYSQRVGPAATVHQVQGLKCSVQLELCIEYGVVYADCRVL